MQWITFQIALESDAGSLLRGDSLFGQLCWLLRLRDGEEALNKALVGYTQDKPFLIVSDACPAGFVPKPEIPAPPIALGSIKKTEAWILRKSWAKRAWLPATALERKLRLALDAEICESPDQAASVLQAHNTINRITGTTGSGAFAPYQMSRLAVTGQRFDVHCLFDPERLSTERLTNLMRDIGLVGAGRDASIGLGKFGILNITKRIVVRRSGPVVTLSPCRPVVGEVNAATSYWRPFTRFGRHGGQAFGAVFKTPVLLADTGALLDLTESPKAAPYVGVGLGGDGHVSRLIPQTVQQAYAPVLTVDLEDWHG